MAEAVIRAMEEYYREMPKPIDWKKVDRLCADFAALPVLDKRTEDELLGYDEFGIPR